MGDDLFRMGQPTLKNTSRRFGIVAAAALALYAFAVWSEAAYYAGGIGFMEQLTWPRMSAAYQATTFADVMKLEALPMGVVAVLGMLVAIGLSFLRRLRIPTWTLGSYLVILLLSGGWIGLVAALVFPFHLSTLDGEFFDDMFARFIAAGLWTAWVLGLFCARLFQSSRASDPASGEPRLSPLKCK